MNIPTGWRSAELTAPVMQQKPALSVIVPVYNQWHLVFLLCEALNCQSITAPYEILLVDNGSDLVDIPPNLPANARLLTCSRPGSYAARNFGVAAAKADWLVFTDADCRPDPGWLGSLLDAASQKGREYLLAGGVLMAPSSIPNAYEIYDLLRGIPQERYVRRGYAATANLAIHRTVFDRIGSFDSNRFSGGDAEFCRRALAAGLNLAFVPQAYVFHPCRSTWEEIERKARRVRGGQMEPGSLRRNRSIIAALVLSPAKRLIDTARAPFPFRYRLIAAAVLLRVWSVEIEETLRLRFGKAKERR